MRQLKKLRKRQISSEVSKVIGKLLNFPLIILFLTWEKRKMKNKFFLKITVIFMLAISLIVIPIVDFLDFSEPAIAATKKKSKKKTRKTNQPKNDASLAGLDQLERDFVKSEGIPNYVVSAGDIHVIRSYMYQFKAVNGNGAVIFIEPNTNSKRIFDLPNDAKVTAEAEFTSHSGEEWTYVQFQNKPKGWVLSRFLVARDPDEDTSSNIKSSNEIKLMVASITGNKVNVRNAPNTNGKVLFQVSKYTHEFETHLIVDSNNPVQDNNGDYWYKVLYHEKNSGGDSWYDKTNGYIHSRFVQLTPLSDIDLMILND